MIPGYQQSETARKDHSQMADRLRQLLNRLRSFFRRAQLDRDLDTEMSAHLDLAIEENLQLGLSSAEARRQALLRFGGTQQATENHREARSLPLLETLLQDLRFAVVFCGLLCAA